MKDELDIERFSASAVFTLAAFKLTFVVVDGDRIEVFKFSLVWLLGEDDDILLLLFSTSELELCCCKVLLDKVTAFCLK